MTMTQMGYSAGITTEGGPSIDWIMASLERRRQDRGKVLEAMRLIRDCYNGDLVIPLPELDTTEASAVANLIVTGIDQSAQRIASVMPAIDYPPLRPGIQLSEERARKRIMANQSWWQHNKLNLKMRRRARWFIGYNSAPAVIRPDYDRQSVCWEIRDPLSAYPAPTQDPDDVCPRDAIFTYFKSWGWLRDRYPISAAQLMVRLGLGARPAGNLQLEMIEYVDAEVTVLGVLGQLQWGSQWRTSEGIASAPYVELERTPTPGGMCPAVVPGRITLDMPRGQFDDAVGMYKMQARLMALEIIAVERGIFPDTYMISRPNETAQFISGPHDGRTGQVNVIKGGDIREQNGNPGFATTGILDRLERNQRVTAGVPSEYGGESPTNVRTGKRGDAVISAVTSFPIQEAQEVFAAALEEENRRAVAIMKACFGNTKKSFHVQARGKTVFVDYVPNEVFETDVNSVTYPMTGADANGIVIQAGQMVGIGLMSKRTAQDLLPMISDPEAENDRVTAEGIHAAVMAALQTQAQQGQIPIADAAFIYEQVVSNRMELFEAIAEAQKRAQERQANSGPAGTPTGPVPPGAPEAQPGLAPPGAGAEAPTVGPPPGGLQNVSQFLQMLKG